MYQAPDFIKVGLKVKTAFANTSSCPYDEGTDYTHKSNIDICREPYSTYLQRIPDSPWLCYSTLDE